jgi:sulfate adenylyltransferase subunit 1
MQIQPTGSLLRFTTAGSVDDGKSTLIGRLLYDSKSIYEDQLEAVKLVSEKRGESQINLALLTDGLRAEREQGITIDVAYRYFSTPKRKFIIADTPGHIQYTRNMVTGASTAHLALILVDARQGVVEQTKRHSVIASLLGIPHIAVCINKMDLVNFRQDIFEQIVSDYKSFAARLNTKDIHFIPISALHGDNVVFRSDNMNWYEGTTLMYLLENIHIESDVNCIDARFPVQYVIRPYNDRFHDYRAYAGRISSGIFRKGDEIVVLPSGFPSVIEKIEMGGMELSQAFAGMSVSMLIQDDVDVSRGDMIVRRGNQPLCTQEFEAMMCWMGEKPLQVNGKYALKHTTRDVRCVIKEIKYRLDIQTISRVTNHPTVGMNDVGKVLIRTTAPIMLDVYTQNRETGSFIVIDETTYVTVGAGMITRGF